MITIKKHLSLKALVNSFRRRFDEASVDLRHTPNVNYQLTDTVISVLACMFYQSRSLMAYQRSLEKRMYNNNLRTQFGVEAIPTDNQIRTIIASTRPDWYASIFRQYQNQLQRGKYLKRFQFMNKYLVAVDATQYYESKSIHCSGCLTQRQRNGETSYFHKALQPVICHPNQRQILPMMPEAIQNLDGATKQDSEISAAKRLLPKLRKQHPKMGFIWLADSLYANAPFIQTIIDNKEEFIFRVKQGDHAKLFEYIDQADYQSHRTVTGDTTIAYRWYEAVPLNNSTDLKVTVLQAFSIKKNRDGSQKSTRIGVWITNIAVTQETIVPVTTAARARWKIENQCFNALKNYGYELGHNWGHVNGEAFIFYIIIMLGFYLHQIFELTDGLYKLCRKACVTYRDLWEELRGLFKLMLFDSWEALLKQCMKNNGMDPPNIVYN